jgi:hypothetical protein
MASEQIPKLSKFAWSIVAILILIGGTRLGIHVRSFIQMSELDEAKQTAKSLTSCEEVFSDAEGNRSGDRIQSKYADPPLPSIVQEGQSRCQTWVKKSQEITKRFVIWNRLLWIAGAILAIATIAVALGVLKKSIKVLRGIMLVFVIQLLAAGGEIGQSILENNESNEILLILWPGIETWDHGWLLMNGAVLTTAVSYSILCLVYLWLTLKVRSKKMWA